MKRYFFSIIFILIILSGCTNRIEQNKKIIIREASGITRIEDKLLIVGDDSDGRYFEIALDGQNGPIIPIDPIQVKEVLLPRAELAMDLESINILADGRIAILSEQLHSLISKKTLHTDDYGIIAEYDKTVIEFDNRGLEGLAVKAFPDGTSRIAVLWEGGYPIYNMLSRQLREHIGRFPFKPVVIVHEIEKGQTAGFVDEPLLYLNLNVPEPEGTPPLAQRFRATDLVWHEWSDHNTKGASHEGFIVLLSSENSPPDSIGVQTRYTTKILQRFDLEGNPVGDPVHINDICRVCLREVLADKSTHISHEMMTHLEEIAVLLEEGSWENVNWEGLDWFEHGKSVITIYDKWPKDPPFALVIPIPEEWK